MYKIRNSKIYKYLKRVGKKYFWYILRDISVAKSKEFRGAMDTTDVSDFNYDELAGNNVQIPSKVDLSEFIGKNQDQTLLYKTRMYCTACTQVHGNDALELDAKKGFLDCEEFGDKQIKLGKLDPTWGAYIVDALYTNKFLGFIDGYALTTTEQQIKEALASGRPIATGSNKINWSETLKNNNIAVQGTSYGHGFLLVGYDNETRLYKFINSSGEDWGDNGYFYMRYEDLHLLFNGRYALFTNDEDIKKFKEILQDVKNSQSMLRGQLYALMLQKYGKENKKKILLAFRKVFNINITEDMLIET